MDIYTKEQWHRDRNFKAVAGQEVEEEVYMSMLECVPPERLNWDRVTPLTAPNGKVYTSGFLCGEPYDHDPVTYRARYMGFAYCGKIPYTRKNQVKFYYLGLLTK